MDTFQRFLLLVIFSATTFQNGQSDLVWSDEFNSPAGSPVDSSMWTYEIGDGSAKGIPGWGNSELEYYTNSVDNVATDGNGHLVITARKENPSQYSCYYGTCQYTSGRLISKSSWKYGRIEARIKTPSGQGLWPAFWMLGDNIGSVGWPACGEIDIMENKGSQPLTVSSALHGPGYSGGQSVHSFTSLTSGPSFADAFHVFAVDWRPTSITWSVDGQPYHVRTPQSVRGNRWVFDRSFNILLNLAVGGHFDGNPGHHTTFPRTLLIDYVRIYNY